jgi:phosphohistidine phosphatase
MRHGKAEQITMNKDDYDRTLTDRGIKNASAMGAHIREHFGVPDLILSSAAQRAHETAIFAAESIGYPETKIVADENLYFASSRWILTAVAKLPNNVNSCLYIGHNPGLTDLINNLHVTLDNLPTASAACFEFDIDSWTDISSKNAIFKWIKLAREL